MGKNKINRECESLLMFLVEVESAASRGVASTRALNRCKLSTLLTGVWPRDLTHDANNDKKKYKEQRTEIGDQCVFES